jgi:hypothetical protein
VPDGIYAMINVVGGDGFLDRGADWRSDIACHTRTTADVSAVADPNTGVAVYDSFGYNATRAGSCLAAPAQARHWWPARSSPPAGDADTYGRADLYAHPGTDALHDIVTGINGFLQTCNDSYICNAKPGYDAPSGNGTPNGLRAFTDVTS